MKAVVPDVWEVDANGFHRDPRLCSAGFIGGVSTKEMGNMAEAVNRQRALERLGLGQSPSFSLRQVHGSVVHGIGASSDAPMDGDGWIVDAPRRVGLIYAADCMPIYIWDKSGTAAAVLHSGWKGTKENIAAAGVAALKRRGLRPDELNAAVGPRIGSCCYAVGDDFKAFFRANSLERRGGKLYLDLGKEAFEQLVEAGLPCEGISLAGSCTCCGDGFFSFRRDKQGARMAAFLAKGNG